MNRIDHLGSLEVAKQLGPVLTTLLQATKYASDTNANIWDFAVGIDDILDVGATKTDLRWLVRKGLVKHAREVTVEGDHGREFRPAGNLTFCEATCFILTESGIAASRSCASVRHQGWTPTRGNSNSQMTGKPALAGPHWNADVRRLQFNAQLVKRFKWPAMNQEMVLCAFEEEGWPERIDDPLPPKPAQNSKRRLADTIKCLNRKQIQELIHFRGDGTGEGVIWERKCNGTRKV